MKKTLSILFLFVLFVTTLPAQEYNQIDADGNVTRRNESGGNAFDKHSKNKKGDDKEIPLGMHVWTIDRRFGDITPAVVDTVPHLFMNTIFNTGLYGEYNTTGNNYTARLSRIFIDRPQTEEFYFVQPYSWVMKQPEDFHFTNTLSPITNITYDNCGDKQNGEDHFEAKFAVNVSKRLGIGFDLNYAYASGYYSNQAASHFGTSLYASYIGDRYQLHTIFSNYHQKASENGGITDDDFITHPESITETFTEDEIPTVLSQNWNRNDNQHFLLSHRYNIGFYRKVKMTEEELKARQFANASKRENELRNNPEGADVPRGRRPGERVTAQGRPDDAAIAGDLPTDSLTVPTDNTRITVDSHEKRDSLLAEEARQDSIDATMKLEYVPVTSIIHTLDLNNYKRIYQAYDTPENYYARSFYNTNDEGVYSGDSIYDKTRHLSVKNTFAIALLEGFNKYAKAGLKVFASHEFRRYEMPDTVTGQTYSTMERWTEHAVNIGGQIIKTQGRTLHYGLTVEAGVAGANAGDLHVDFNTDLNFPLFGDTVQLAANAFLHRSVPVFFQEHYHSKHLWWDQDLESETRLRIEGLFSYPKTKTQLRVAVEEIKNYAYFGMSYDASSTGRTNMTASSLQHDGAINLLTAQLRQNFRLGILNWDNIITYQNSTNKDVLPLPTLNIFSNLYLKFKIVRQLTVELGGDVTYFTKYYAPDFCPQLNQYAIQQNDESRVELGNYPFVDVYANMHLKRTRFFIMYSHVNAGSGTRDYFLTPHYPMNKGVLRFGLSWNFLN